MARKTTRRRRRSAGRPKLVSIGMLKEAGTFAAGFVAADVVMTKIPLPAALNASPATRAISTVGVGMVAGALLSRFLGARTGTALATGMIANGIVQFGRQAGIRGIGEFDGSADPDMIAAIAALSDDDIDMIAVQALEAASDPFVSQAQYAIDDELSNLIRS